MQGSRVQRLDERTAEFWVGYLASALEAAEPSLKGHAASDARRALTEWRSSQAARPDEEVIAFGVVDALGECYALRDTMVDALKARGEAVDYLDGAATCGHSMAVRWVSERLPFAVVGVTEEEFERFLTMGGTPVLDREP